MPGIGDVMEGAMQHAPQPGRQSMSLQVEKHPGPLVLLRRIRALREEQTVDADVPGTDQLVAHTLGARRAGDQPAASAG